MIFLAHFLARTHLGLRLDRQDAEGKKVAEGGGLNVDVDGSD